MSVHATTNLHIIRLQRTQLAPFRLTPRGCFTVSTKPFCYHGFTAKIDGGGDTAKTPVKNAPREPAPAGLGIIASRRDGRGMRVLH
jgi:hypothetical protein